MEVVVKLVTFGCRNYFKDNFNTFDFKIVFSSLAEIGLNLFAVAFCNQCVGTALHSIAANLQASKELEGG